MKSGIYKTPNGNLIYVAKDRTIKATSTTWPAWSGTKVSHRAKDDTVVIEGTEYRCTRYADVPNGCNDPERAIADALMAKCEEGHKEFAEGAAAASDDNFALSIGDDTEVRSRLKSEGFRFCHSQSARKHRRRGREVRYVPEARAFAWRAAA